MYICSEVLSPFTSVVVTCHVDALLVRNIFEQHERTSPTMANKIKYNNNNKKLRQNEKSKINLWMEFIFKITTYSPYKYYHFNCKPKMSTANVGGKCEILSWLGRSIFFFVSIFIRMICTPVNRFFLAALSLSLSPDPKNLQCQKWTKFVFYFFSGIRLESLMFVVTNFTVSHSSSKAWFPYNFVSSIFCAYLICVCTALHRIHTDTHMPFRCELLKMQTLNFNLMQNF